MAIGPAIIRRGIAIAEEQTRPLRTPVWYKPVTGRDEAGPVYGDWIELTDEFAPLIEKVGEGVPTAQGVESVAKSKLTFLVPLNVKDRDLFRTDDTEDEWSVMRVEALLDPDKQPYMVEVWLGEQAR